MFRPPLLATLYLLLSSILLLRDAVHSVIGGPGVGASALKVTSPFLIPGVAAEFFAAHQPDEEQQGNAAEETRENPGEDSSRRRLRTISELEEERAKDIPDLADEDAQLETLGPIVVNTDGTLSRIDNWKGMTKGERALTLKRLRKRNSERLERIKLEKGDDL